MNQLSATSSILWYLYWIPRKLSLLASLLPCTTQAHCNHPQCLFWQRLQLNSCLQLKSIYRSNPYSISLRPKWAPNFWQFLTLNCPPNWICSQNWPLTIHSHWRTQRPWATYLWTRQWNFTLWTPKTWWQWHWSNHKQWYLPWTHTTKHLRWSTWPSTKNDTTQYNRKWPHTSKNVLSHHNLLTQFTLPCWPSIPPPCPPMTNR